MSATFTRREVEVLELIAEGFANREIGEHLYVSEETVKTHVKTLLEKLHARSRAHAVALALRGGLLA
jgi:DNA-binding NarL/FixJ family response regulator